MQKPKTEKEFAEAFVRLCNDWIDYYVDKTEIIHSLPQKEANKIIGMARGVSHCGTIISKGFKTSTVFDYKKFNNLCDFKVA